MPYSKKLIGNGTAKKKKILEVCTTNSTNFYSYQSFPTLRIDVLKDFGNDIETAFNIDPWSGPAKLEVKGPGTFDLMTKLTSPRGLVGNTNSVRQERVHNIGGFDQADVTYIRFINIVGWRLCTSMTVTDVTDTLE